MATAKLAGVAVSALALSRVEIAMGAVAGRGFLHGLSEDEDGKEPARV